MTVWPVILQSPNLLAWARGYGFRRIRCFLWEDFNPFWSIECQHHFPVKNIDDGHDDVAIDDDSFALGTNESLHDSGPPNIALLGN